MFGYIRFTWICVCEGEREHWPWERIVINYRCTLFHLSFTQKHCAKKTKQQGLVHWETFQSSFNQWEVDKDGMTGSKGEINRQGQKQHPCQYVCFARQVQLYSDKLVIAAFSKTTCFVGSSPCVSLSLSIKLFVAACPSTSPTSCPSLIQIQSDTGGLRMWANGKSAATYALLERGGN